METILLHGKKTKMKTKTLYHITARRNNSMQIVDLYYKSVEEAAARNPTYSDFIIVGTKHE